VLMIQEAEFVVSVSVRLARHACISCFIPFQLRPLYQVGSPIQSKGPARHLW
jgi:hypothetical protein